MYAVVENLVVFAVVAAAVGYVARRTWTFVVGRRRGGCGTCGSCPAGGERNAPQVIGVKTLLRPAQDEKR